MSQNGWNCSQGKCAKRICQLNRDHFSARESRHDWRKTHLSCASPRSTPPTPSRFAPPPLKPATAATGRWRKATPAEGKVGPIWHRNLQLYIYITLSCSCHIRYLIVSSIQTDEGFNVLNAVSRRQFQYTASLQSFLSLDTFLTWDYRGLDICIDIILLTYPYEVILNTLNLNIFVIFQSPLPMIFLWNKHPKSHRRTTRIGTNGHSNCTE
jgi:hypothetical protein